MKVLITGAGGFIGSHLVDSQLKKGHDVRAVDLHLDLLKDQAGNPCLEVIRADITQPNLLQEIVKEMDVVYHLASAHLDVSLSEDRYRRVNVDATMNLLTAARQAGVKCFVHCSSVGVIGDVEKPPADEHTECRPTNIYERTKLDGERAVMDFAKRTLFPVVIVRPAWVYGPRCPRTAKLFRTISKGRFPIFGSGRNLRHPVYITDTVRALELGAETPDASGEIFIIAGQSPVETRELVNLVSQEMNVRIQKIYLPIFLGICGGLILELVFKLAGQQPPFSRRSIDFFLKHNAYDIGKAQRMLNYQPQVDLRSGIKKTLASMAIESTGIKKHA
jgi:nucleoside-diphosphate-sugar epimerase